MPYSIDKTNGTTIAVVEDGTIDSTLDIKLIGKNYAGYGEAQNENFVHMLENFAGAGAPPRPISGQLWYDTGSRKLKFYDASTIKWKATGGAEVSGTAPTGLAQGDFWFDSTNKQIYVYDGAAYVLVGPQGVAGLGTTEMQSAMVTDNDTAASHAIVKAIVDGEVMFIISSDEFILSTESAIPGFSYIKSGMTLVNTNNSDGVTDTGSGRVLWGTASNTLRFAGRPIDDFILAGSGGTEFGTVVHFADAGYTVGDDQDLVVKIDTDGITPLIKNAVNNTIKFQTTSSGPVVNTPLKLEGAHVLPGTTAVTDLGSGVLTFRNAYASVFYGSGAGLTGLNGSQVTSGTIPTARLSGTYPINITGTAGVATSATTATQADTLKVGSNYRTATVDTATTGTSNSIACRDESGNLNAVLFQGTATSALFADLAEKYLTDVELAPGTVVCVGGEAEVTACSLGDRAFGAVSTNPAFMMNEGLEGGTYIALKGRVPLRVVGAVKKGDKLIAADNGCAGTASTLLKHIPIRAGNFPDTFAIALETSDDEGVKIIEAIIL
jgi:hypothetical protein